MAMHADNSNHRQVRKEFADGLERFHNSDYAGALLLFRSAEEAADPGDSFRSRYTSFHGLARMYLGDSSGIKHCRKAAAGEIHDAAVYYNLAMLEYRLNNHESALAAVRRGLRIDPAHAGLLCLKKDMRTRARYGQMPGRSGLNPINRLLDKLLRGRNPAQSDE